MQLAPKSLLHRRPAIARATSPGAGSKGGEGAAISSRLSRRSAGFCKPTASSRAPYRQCWELTHYAANGRAPAGLVVKLRLSCFIHKYERTQRICQGIKSDLIRYFL